MNLMSVPKCWLIIAELEFSMRLQVIRRKTFPFVVKTSPFNTSFEGWNYFEEIFGFFRYFFIICWKGKTIAIDSNQSPVQPTKDSKCAHEKDFLH